MTTKTVKQRNTRQERRRKSPARALFDRLRKNPSVVLGFTIILLWTLAAIFAPWLAPKDPLEVNFIGRVPPSGEFWLGTDRLGRDMLSRILFGARISPMIGVVSVIFGLIIGTTIGTLAGYVGGNTDTVLMRFIDALLALPGILLALVVIAALGPSLANVMIAVGIATVPEYARLARSSVLSVREMPYIEAAKVLGGGNLRVIMWHVLPNITAPLIVLSTLKVGSAILVGSGLSFLGMGAQPPTPEWGLMTAEGRAFLDRAWWISTFPGLAILTTVMAFNLLGDGLREALDPHMENR